MNHTVNEPINRLKRRLYQRAYNEVMAYRSATYANVSSCRDYPLANQYYTETKSFLSDHSWKYIWTITFSKFLKEKSVEGGDLIRSATIRRSRTENGETDEFRNDKNKGTPLHYKTKKIKRPRTDHDIDRIIRLLHEFFFGKKHLRKSGHQFTLLIVREGEYKDHEHFHILIEDHPLLTLDKLADAVIFVSENCQCLDRIYSHEKDRLTERRNEWDGSTSSDNKPIKSGRDLVKTRKINMNVVDLPTEVDRENMLKYLTKEMMRHDYSNYDLKTTDTKDYYPILTKV